MAEIEGVEHLAYIILDVTYRRDANYGQDLAWVAHELKDAAGLELTEDLLDMDCAQCGASACPHGEDGVPHHQDADDEDGIDRAADADHTPVFPDDLFPSRRWAGTITEAEFRALKSAWSLDLDSSQARGPLVTEFGRLTAEVFRFDGMDWEVGGETPINDVDLYVCAPASWWEERQSCSCGEAWADEPGHDHEEAQS